MKKAPKRSAAPKMATVTKAARLQTKLRAMQAECDAAVARDAATAIENARLLTELRESLERQTATGDILSVIAGTPNGSQRALDTIAETAARLFGAAGVAIRRIEGNVLRMVSSAGAMPGAMRQSFPTAPLDRTSLPGQCALENRQIHIEDRSQHDAAGPNARRARELHSGTIACTPLSREGEAIGAMMVHRNEVRPFQPSELELMKGFAAQAVIAIENARLLTELRESLDRQTATSEVLSVISSSPGELEPVFDAMLANATRLCGASYGALFRYNGDEFRAAAIQCATEVHAELLRRGPRRAKPESGLGRVVATHKSVHIPDLWLDDGYQSLAQPEANPEANPILVGGVRSLLSVPMLKDNELIGVISIYQFELRPFTEKQVALLENFAAQAVIAIENARLLTELRESLDRQTATAEVLGVISSSPGALEPVFETILDNALRLCQTDVGHLYRLDADGLRLGSVRGALPEYLAFLRQPGTFSLGPDAAGAVRRNEPLQIADMRELPAYAAREPRVVAAVELGGARTALFVPMVREGEPVGLIIIQRHEIRPFTDKHIDLVVNFAKQAVIAIENARLLTELRESLDRQTATADILRVIASTPGDPKRALDTMAETALRLFGAGSASFLRVDGGMLRSVSFAGPFDTAIHTAMPNVPLDPAYRVARCVLEGRQIEGDTVTSHTNEWMRQSGQKLPIRSVAFTPLLRQGEAIGAMVVNRSELRPFTPSELELMRGFADQAVIAIENARLLTELRESLDRQTATAEVLGVISSSPGALEPIFDAMLFNAMRICDAPQGTLWRFDGQNFQAVANRGVPPAYVEFLKAPVAPGVATNFARMIETKAPSGSEDLATSPGYETRQPVAIAAVDLGGIRTTVHVPMLKNNEIIGAISIFRQEVRPFTDKQIELVENFAAQAVIAIENARLLTELHESLDRQTATAEVLGVISSSPGQLDPVFATMLDKAIEICAAKIGLLYLFDGEGFSAVTTRGLPPDYLDMMPRVARHPARGTALGEVWATRRTSHIHDYTATDAFAKREPLAVAVVEKAGCRTVLAVPMLRERELIGVFTIARAEVLPFSGKQVELLENFAAQAVIAIENARLLTELRESLDRQTATSEVLRVISTSPGELTPVFRAMVTNAARICDTQFGTLQLYDGDDFTVAAACGELPAAYREWATKTQGKVRGGPKTVSGQVAAMKQTVHIADYRLEPAYLERDVLAVLSVETVGIRTVLGVPMVKDNEFLGLITVFRQEVRPFTEKQIELVENFAAQAVIAIENARLLTELRDRTNELAQRQAELRVTFDNMGDGVAMFDADLRLAAWNRNLQEILDLPDAFFAEPRTYRDYIAYLIEHGEFGDVDLEEEVRRYIESADQQRRVERTRPDGRVLEVRVNPVPGGGFVAIYSDITERKRAEEQVRGARDAAEKALGELKAAQANLVQAEKMASLGQLTAGIAHEIKNPLNFVNNFAGLSVELLDELKQATAPAMATLDQSTRGEVDEVMDMLTGNLEKIAEHGRRADGIVKSMLAHSRGGSGERQSVNINALVEESLNLAYHGARAQDQNFNIALERDFDQSIAPLEVVPQDITRVFLNLFGNGFYAANKRRTQSAADPAFRPVLKVTIRDLDADVAISIRDNGIGIPFEIREKLFEPFFTTKPTGEGTGLGLSISYEIVTQQHGGTIEVDSRVGEFTEFTIRLPRRRGAARTANS